MSPEEAREALETRPQRTTRRGLSPEERALRSRINSKAQAKAVGALMNLHRDEYRTIYQIAQADLLAEAGLA